MYDNKKYFTLNLLFLVKSASSVKIIVFLENINTIVLLSVQAPQVMDRLTINVSFICVPVLTAANVSP